jgi:predicted HicB family RNase H-like nuclease
MPIVRLNLRLPEELHARLTALACEQRRSLNQQIVFILETALSLESLTKETP